MTLHTATQPTATPRPGLRSAATRGRIVVGVDPSENAGRAVDWAAREAADRGLTLHLVHALDLPGTVGAAGEPPGYLAARRTAGEDLLAKTTSAVREQDPRLTVSSEIAVLGAAETLVNLSQDAELVVTGTRGHGGFAGLLLGSVSLKLATHAHCPSVVVHGGETGEPLNEIVLGLEPGQAQAPVHFAFATAAALGATICAVRAWWPLPDYSDYSIDEDLEARRQAEDADTRTLLKAVREDYPDVTVTTHAIRGHAVPSLIGAAHSARLLVVGAHHHHGPLSVGAGPVVRGLLAHSPTPVAIVPIT
jgi:nucleotide-binding universal stress UspA family protein